MFGQPGPTRMFVPKEAPVLPSPSPLPVPWSSEPPSTVGFITDPLALVASAP